MIGKERQDSAKLSNWRPKATELGRFVSYLVGGGMDCLSQAEYDALAHGLRRGWPNRRIHALKAKALLSGSESGRGFGSVFHHHTQGLGQSPGPFFRLRSPRHAGFRLAVLRVRACQDARHRPFPGREPSLFSVRPAGGRSVWPCKINDLRAPVRCQPRPPEHWIDHSHYPCFHQDR